MCMSLHLSFKKNVKFFLKVVIWASKAKKWPCQAVLEIFQDMVKSLGKNLSFSSSLVNTGQHRKKLTYLGYYPTFSVARKACKDWEFGLTIRPVTRPVLQAGLWPVLSRRTVLEI